jgi:hypothetical protein
VSVTGLNEKTPTVGLGSLVELQGFEPWSKQAAKLLSTCLSFSWDFGLEPGKGDPIRGLSFLSFRAGTEALPALSCILSMLP